MMKFIPLIFTLLTAFNAQAENAIQPVSVDSENNQIISMLQQNKKNFALLYFVQPGCIYCQHQMPVMNEFQKETDWYIKTIDIVQNPEVRSKFNVNGTPVIVLIKKNAGANNWQAVSIGYSPLNTLRADIYKLVRIFNGLTPQGQFYVRSQNNATTPITK